MKNTASGVLIEAEGAASSLEGLVHSLQHEFPPLASITALRITPLVPTGDTGFTIESSSATGSQVQISPDCDVCADCLAEMADPANRRYRYPFINCTNCGPRYSIITGTPYDRPLTTMSVFPLCDRCRTEYEDPLDRRFHAQPVSCPDCGPRLSLTSATGEPVAGDPLAGTVRLLQAGKIVAIKGVGGYHLAVDPCNDAAVSRLRERKRRDEKPFALMAAHMQAVRALAHADDVQERLLRGPERPIVLLRKRKDAAVSPLVAPANDYLGIMLPAAPHHHLILDGTFTALVMTSANLTDEPVVYRDEEAHASLVRIADYFLTHDRGIQCRSDDSVIRVFQGSPLFLRRSRGYVPRSVRLPFDGTSVLAVGGELKGTVCLTRGDRAFLSQHIGDLKNPETLRALEETAEHLKRLLRVEPALVTHDLHPDYLSTEYARRLGLPTLGVQHHHAHMAACMAENGLDGEVIGVILDGTGYGTDGTVWGGEFLLGGYRTFRRLGHFRQVPLPGGDAAVKEPFRMAAAYLHQCVGEGLFDLPAPCLGNVRTEDRGLFLKMLERGLNSPATSSCGRLFDAVASLIGVRDRISYEGQAAIELEGLADAHGDAKPYPFAIQPGTVVDFSPAVAAILDDLLAGKGKVELAAAFHATVSAACVAACGEIRTGTGVDRVVLSGGSFQSRLLTEGIHNGLSAAGFQVFTHRLVPPNDGGLALGQAAVAMKTPGM